MSAGAKDVDVRPPAGLWRYNTGVPGMPDLVGYVGGRRVELDVVPAPRKRCLSCGRLQNDDGTLDCGH